jgi:transcriptional regulator GlxA family with amidase domain
VEELAEVASLSPRQFNRAFSAETGQSPAKAIEHLRVEAARLMLEQGRHSMDVIAHEVGLYDRDRMRRAFLRTLGQPPQAIRRFGREGRLTLPRAKLSESRGGASSRGTCAPRLYRA